MCLINSLNSLKSETLQIVVELTELLRPLKEFDSFLKKTVQAVAADRTQVYQSMKSISSWVWAEEVGEDETFISILLIFY